MCVVIRIDNGSQSGHQVWLRGRESMTVGNTAWADYLVPDPALSAVHFQLSATVAGCRILALDSNATVRVNGYETCESELGDQDIILAGATRFRVIVQSPVPAERSPKPGSNQRPAARNQRSQRNSPFVAILELDSESDLDSELAPRRFWLRDRQLLSVGCSHWADVALPSGWGLDSVHFAVQTEFSRCYLRDLGSSTGVRVNGHLVDTTTLQDGDEIIVGQAKLRVRLEGNCIAWQ